MSINFEQYYRGVLPISIDKSNFKVSLSFNATLATTSGKLGINLDNVNTWTVKQTFEPQIYVYSSVGAGYFNDFTLFGTDIGGAITTYRDNNQNFGLFIIENYASGYFGMMNKGTSTFNGLAANSFVYNLIFNGNGAVYTSGTVGTFGVNDSATARSTLDNGSGGMSVAGGLTVVSTATFKSGITGSGNTGDLTAGSGIYGSFNAGSGLSYSSGQFANTGVLSLQGSTGALSLSAGSGISISGLTITNSSSNVDYPAQANSWTALQTYEQIYVYGGGNGSGYFNDFAILGENTTCPITTYWDNSGKAGMFMLEGWSVGTFGMLNKGTSTFSGLAANGFVYNLVLGFNGAVYTSGSVGTLGVASGLSYRNTLDNGSGGMSVAGGLTVTSSATFKSGMSVAGGLTVTSTATFKSNVDIDGSLSVNGNIISNKEGGYVSAYNEQVLMFSGGTAVNGTEAIGGISIAGRPRIGDWGDWLVLGEPNGTNNGNVIQIMGDGGIYTGHSAGITSTLVVRNVLDNGSGAMSAAGGLTVTSSATFKSGISVAGSLTVTSSASFKSNVDMNNNFLTSFSTYGGGSATVGVEVYSATNQYGVVEVEDTYSFENNTGHSIMVILTMSTGLDFGNPSYSSGYTQLSNSDGNANIEFGILANSGYIQYNSFRMVYMWFVLA